MEEEKNPIFIECICGVGYDAPRTRLLQCQSCGHVWDLRPDLPMENLKPAVGVVSELFKELRRKMELYDCLGIIDMSNDFVDGSLPVGKPAEAIVPTIVKLAEEYRKAGKIVAFFMDQHAENDDHFARWPKHNVVGTKGAELYGELGEWYKAHADEKNVIFIPKANYNGFYKTLANDILQTKGVKSIALTGVCTDICVFLTAAGADAYGYKTGVYQNACATFNTQHDAFVNQMSLCFKTEVLTA